MYNFIKDKYYKARGSYVRILDICCRSCGNHLCFYQKDGPGNLRRMYMDRIILSELHDTSEEECLNHKGIACKKCAKMIGTCYIYEKEKRKAIILYQDAIKKYVVSREKIH